MNPNNKSENIGKKIEAILNTCRKHYGNPVSSETHTRDNNGVTFELSYNDKIKIFCVDNNPVTLPDELLQTGWGELESSLMKDYENELKETPLSGIFGLNPTRQMNEEIGKFNQKNLKTKLDNLLLAAKREYGPRTSNDLNSMKTTLYEGNAYATIELVGKTIQVRIDDHPFILPDIKARGLWVPISGPLHLKYHDNIKKTPMNKGSIKELSLTSQDPSRWRKSGNALFTATKTSAAQMIDGPTINQGYHQGKMYMSFEDLTGQVYQLRFDPNNTPEIKVDNSWNEISGDILKEYQKLI